MQAHPRWIGLSSDFASGQTDGLLALAEVQLPPLTAGPTLHVHANEDEMFFVLEA
jgi:uncharacterized cupin superfamily protein